MPRDRYPARPGSQVIGHTWPPFHRQVADGQMLDLCLIVRPQDEASFDETAGRSVYPDPVPVYEGRCRAQASARLSDSVEVGGRTVVVRRYLVALPIAVADLEVNDQLTVTACAADAALVGLPLRIIDVLTGTVAWQRDVVCEELTPTAR